ncbi:MAG: HipA domain-containing protein [Betaproteobacteria bacterium]|nr:HipA domain-containing protein [Betaproteobacteria bacterium]
MALGPHAEALYGILSVSGVRTVAELVSRTRLSQPTLSRALRELKSARPTEFVSFGMGGKTVGYGLRQSIRGLPLSVPLHACNGPGPVAARIGVLSALCGGGFVFSAQEGTAPGRERIRYFAGLPWFVRDMVPQGYVGRAFCRAWAGALHVAGNPQEWSDPEAFFILASKGADAPGNLVLGQANLDDAGVPRAEAPVDRDQSGLAALFDRMAQQSVAGEFPGSSAAGEFPKFVTRYRAHGQVRNVIVKFSPEGEDPVAIRWKDLLVAEQVALETLAGNRIRTVASATSRLVRGQSRIYLEVDRFDRSGENARAGVVTLATLDDEFVGRRASWTDTAASLVALGMVSRADADALRFLEAFGRCIGNSDMHHGNVSFFRDDHLDGRAPPALTLAPAYDMLPMLYAPERGEIVARTLALQPDTDRTAAAVALQFWQAVAARDDVSPAFRAIARANETLLSRI